MTTEKIVRARRWVQLVGAATGPQVAVEMKPLRRGMHVGLERELGAIGLLG